MRPQRDQAQSQSLVKRQGGGPDWHDWFVIVAVTGPNAAGRVRWHLPTDAISVVVPDARADRFDLTLFDRFIEALPPVR